MLVLALDATQITVTTIGAIATIGAASLPGVIAIKRSRATEQIAKDTEAMAKGTESTSVKRAELDAAIVEWRALYNAAKERAERAERRSDEAIEATEECMERERRLIVRIERLEGDRP